MPNSSSRFDHEYAEELIRCHTDEIYSSNLCAQPKVTVIIHTYNHASFLEDAINSVLAQQTSFPFEIIVGDDCSRDGAQEIVREYQKKNPDQIKLLLSTENLGKYTGGGRLNLLRSFQAARGQYLAYLEGDDLWTDTLKLEKQVNYLDENPGAAGCFHNSITFDGNGKVLQNFFNREYNESYTQKKCLTDLGSAYASASLMFRSKVIKGPLPNYYLIAGSDYLLDLVITEYGTLDYLSFAGCAYRIHQGGSWSQLSLSEQNVLLINRYEVLLNDPVMCLRYEKEIKKLINMRYRKLRIILKKDMFPEFERLRMLSTVSSNLSGYERLLWKIYTYSSAIKQYY